MNKNQNRIIDALERGCIFIDHIAIDECGNEYRDKNGECIVMTDNDRQELIKKTYLTKEMI